MRNLILALIIFSASATANSAYAFRIFTGQTGCEFLWKGPSYSPAIGSRRTFSQASVSSDGVQYEAQILQEIVAEVEFNGRTAIHSFNEFLSESEGVSRSLRMFSSYFAQDGNRNFFWNEVHGAWTVTDFVFPPKDGATWQMQMRFIDGTLVDQKSKPRKHTWTKIGDFQIPQTRKKFTDCYRLSWEGERPEAINYAIFAPNEGMIYGYFWTGVKKGEMRLDETIQWMLESRLD